MSAPVREREGRAGAPRPGQVREVSVEEVRERQRLDTATRVIAFRNGKAIDRTTLSPRVQDAIVAAQRAVVDAEPKKPAAEKRIVVNASGTKTVIDIVTGHQDGVSVDPNTGVISLKTRSEQVKEGTWPFRTIVNRDNHGEAKVARVILGAPTKRFTREAVEVTVVEARGGEVRERSRKVTDLDSLFEDAYDHAIPVRRTLIPRSGHESFGTALRIDLGEASGGDERAIQKRIRHTLAVIDHDPAYAQDLRGTVIVVGAGASSVAVGNEKNATKLRLAGVTKKYQIEGMPLLDPTKIKERKERTGVLKIGVPVEHIHDVRLLTTEGLIRVVPGNRADDLRKRKVEFVADAAGEITLGYRQTRTIEREASRIRPRLEALLAGKNSIIAGRNPDPSEIVIALGLRAPRLDRATRAPEQERAQARRNGLGLQRLVQTANEHVRGLCVEIDKQFADKGNQRSRYDIAVQVVAEAYRRGENINADLVTTLIETIAPKSGHEKLSAAAVRAVEALSTSTTDIGRKRLQALLREAGVPHDQAGRLAQTITRDAGTVARDRDRRGRGHEPERGRKAPTEAGIKAALLDFFVEIQGMSGRARTTRTAELQALIARVPDEEVRGRLSAQLGSVVESGVQRDPTPREQVVALLRRDGRFVPTRTEAHAVLSTAGYEGSVIEAYLDSIYGKANGRRRRVKAEPNGRRRE
ncbi:MAG TPA: hypothetical protein VLF20_06060 [Patescibacteria group bacterium]|nr:hypothetical protein [Patescibacteria group bacterium]